MTDVDQVVTEFLLSRPALASFYGTRIYASLSLPTDYTPAQGAGLLLARRGGPLDFSSKVLKPSMQFRTYALNESQARAADRALFDTVHDAKFGKIKAAFLEAVPTLLTDQETGWPYMLAFYGFLIAN